MKGILKKTAGTGSSYWTITYPHGTDKIHDGVSIFFRDYKEMSNVGASSIFVYKEDADKLTNDDYDTIVEFEIIDVPWNNTTYKEAKLKK
jgi:hypothetical protein